MKLSIAAGILLQALPVASETNVSAWLSSSPKHQKAIFKKNEASRNGGARAGRGYQEVTSWFNSRSTRTSSRKLGRTRGALVNQPEVSDHSNGPSIVVCDPMSSDPDVGLLSCGFGKTCIPSKKSVLGGICSRQGPQGAQTRTAQHNPGIKARLTGAKYNTWAPDKIFARRLHNIAADRRACDPQSSDPDIGVLSCQEGHQCTPSKNSPLRGECTGTTDKYDIPVWLKKGGLKTFQNKNKKIWKKGTMKECDPAAAVDLGVLSCGINEACIESEYSEMGGVCAVTESRRLSWLDPTYLCDNWSYRRDVNLCDCVNFDNVTKSGSITCEFKEKCMGSLYYGCYATCGAQANTYLLENDELTTTTYCFNFTSPTPKSYCFTYSYDQTSCQVDFNGESCVSCTSFGFDCSNVESGLVPSKTRAFLAALPIIQECYKPVDGYYCSLCGESSLIPYNKNTNTSIALTGFGSNLTCYELQQASWNNQISTEKCPEAVDVAQSSCCAYQCHICGSTDYIAEGKSDTVISVPGMDHLNTCGDLSSAAYTYYTIPRDSCAAIAEIGNSSCCSYVCNICGSYGYVSETLNSVNLTNVPGYGDTTCGTIASAVYKYMSLDKETCLLVAENVRDSCCWDFQCKVCGPNATIPFAFDNITVTLPGVGSVSCYDIYREAYLGRAQQLSCEDLSQAAQESCCRGAYYVSCEVCGPLGEIPSTNYNLSVSLPDLGILTCYDIFFGSYIDGSISNEMCSAVSGYINETCCRDRYFATPYARCYICSDGTEIINPSAIVSSNSRLDLVTCSQLVDYAEFGFYDEYDCEYLKSFATDVCCGASLDTSTPSSAPESDNDTPPEMDPATRRGGGSMIAWVTLGKSHSIIVTTSAVALITSTLFWLVDW